jgi:hypothetical protein
MQRLLCFAAFAAPLWAGVHIQVESTNTGTGETSKQEILLDAQRLRINMPAKDSDKSVMFLTDGGRNRIVMLDKNRNEYREMDEQTMNQMSQQLQGFMAQMQEQMKNMPPQQREMVEKMMKGKMGQMAGRGAAPVRTVFTAKGSGSVNGFSCTKYDGMRGAEKVAEVCAAKPSDLKLSPSDFQVFDKMKEFAANLQTTFANAVGASDFRSVAEFGYDGFPVEQTTFSGGKPETKSELKSITRASFSDADFSLGDAKKVEIPIPPAGKR